MVYRQMIMVMLLAFGLLLTPTARATEKNQYVVGRVLGNGDAAIVGVGLAEGIAEWGVEAMWQPDQSQTWFGLWGALNTPEATLLPENALPPFWKGLDVQGFLSLDVMTDQDFERLLVQPGAGVRLAPLETMSLVGQVTYPMGQGGVPTQLDLNEIAYWVGLEIRF